jgi:putative membrane protein
MTVPATPPAPRAAEAGQEPDYRFTLANERTFLAWIRTALALIAGGVTVAQLLGPFSVSWGRRGLATALIAAGTVVAGTSVRRWRRVQRAMRAQADLPATRLPAVLTGFLLITGAAVLVLSVLEP